MREPSALTRRQRAAKRTFDLVVAVPLLVLTSPVVAVAVVAARISTGEPGIFRQVRVGRDGRLFTVYKVRTMRTVADRTSTVTTRTDVRVTRVGRIVRSLKVDELPQLVNVVRGDMSLVGPRPDVPGFADLLQGDDRLVLSVRPGITGPATLHFRHEEDLLASVDDPEAYNLEVVFPAKVRMNLRYVRSWSVALDLRYLARTVRQVMRRSADSGRMVG